MQLTAKQEQAVKLCVDNFRAGRKYTVIAGVAGAGKSTAVKFIISALSAYGINPDEDVAYCAFTGKAASVLTQKGCPNAMTAHKLLYQARPLPNGKFMYIKKRELEYRVIICDECGMLPKSMVDSLLAHNNIYVIFCGDNGQLPPINKDEDNHLLDKPDIFLDEVMRQAADSGIIQLSMKIRNGESIDGFKSDDAIVLPKSELNTGMLEWGDMILCATNKTRISLNTQIRGLKGYDKPIVDGEKLICCRNYWNDISDNGNALTNGCVGYISHPCDSFQRFPAMFKVPNNKVDITCATFVSEYGDDFGSLDMDTNCIITGETALTPKMKYNIGRNKKYSGCIPYEFTYSYVVTTHRAQGSEWDKVLVIEENFPFDKIEHKRWLYTAVTRGSQRVVLVR